MTEEKKCWMCRRSRSEVDSAIDDQSEARDTLEFAIREIEEERTARFEKLDELLDSLNRYGGTIAVRDVRLTQTVEDLVLSPVIDRGLRLEIENRWTHLMNSFRWIWIATSRWGEEEVRLGNLRIDYDSGYYTVSIGNYSSPDGNNGDGFEARFIDQEFKEFYSNWKMKSAASILHFLKEFNIHLRSLPLVSNKRVEELTFTEFVEMLRKAESTYSDLKLDLLKGAKNIQDRRRHTSSIKMVHIPSIGINVHLCEVCSSLFNSLAPPKEATP